LVLFDLFLSQGGLALKPRLWSRGAPVAERGCTRATLGLKSGIDNPTSKAETQGRHKPSLQSMSSSHQNVFEELKKLTCQELQSSRKLVDLLTAKLDLVSPSSVNSLQGYDQLQELARLFLAAILDVLRDRYQALSIRCFAHLCVALDYLLDPDDSIRDSDPKGHEDDREFLRKTAERFKSELDHYRKWKQQTGDPW
jgi:hypothetical protein